MTKQEEIRDGVAEVLASMISSYTWRDLSEHSKIGYRIEAGKLLSYLHSQGVVIKVDRECPSIDMASLECATKIGVFHATQIDMLETGYVATEPLICCPSCKKEPCECPSINRGSFAKYVEEGCEVISLD